MTTQKNRNIEPKKVTAERFNGYAALFGWIVLVGAYATNTATITSIADKTLNFSASRDMVVFEICIK